MSGLFVRLGCDSPHYAATIDLPVDDPNTPGVRPYASAKVSQLARLGWGVVHVNGDNGGREEALLCSAHVYIVRQFLPLPAAAAAVAAWLSLSGSLPR